MSIKLMAAAWDLNIPSAEKMVLLCLCDFAGDQGECWPSIKTIAHKCSKSERTVQGAIKWLRDNGYCDWNDEPGKPHMFRLNPRKICTPAKSAPPQKLHETPADSAPKPLGTTISSEATASSDKRARLTNEWPCPDGVDPVDWSSLIENRKAKRAPLTPGAYRQIVRKLEAWAEDGWPPGPVVAHAAELGWTTVFPTDEMKALRNGQRTMGRHQPANDGLSATTRAAVEVFGPCVEPRFSG